MDILLNSNELIGKLESNTKLFREGMTEAGFTIGGMDHPICPVMIGDAHLANDLANELLSEIFLYHSLFPPSLFLYLSSSLFY